jgi:hypothetical protein
VATSLIKKSFLPINATRPIRVMTDNLLHHEEIKCPHCPQTYLLGFSDGEQFRRAGWRVKAVNVISGSHYDDGHELIALPLPGIP